MSAYEGKFVMKTCQNCGRHIAIAETENTCSVCYQGNLKQAKRLFTREQARCALQAYRARTGGDEDIVILELCEDSEVNRKTDKETDKGPFVLVRRGWFLSEEDLTQALEGEEETS